MFLHELTRILRSNGVRVSRSFCCVPGADVSHKIFVTYQLTPSDSDVVVIQSIPLDGTSFPATIDREIVHEVGLKRR